MRATRKTLVSMVSRLNERLHRPLEPYRTDSAKHVYGNEGHFLLYSVNPDGRPRHALHSMLASTGQHQVSPLMSGCEMWTYLRGVHDVLDSLQGRDGGNRNFADAAAPNLRAALAAIAEMSSGENGMTEAAIHRTGQGAIGK